MGRRRLRLPPGQRLHDGVAILVRKNRTVMKKVIIMGASSGIGLHCAEALASRGVKVGVAARHTAPLEALKERYPDFVEYMSIDVTKTDAVRRLEDLISLTGGMDIYPYLRYRL